MLGFCPLASGSKGNCVYLGTSRVKVLIDAGLSGRMTAHRLASIGISLTEIDAILITHEHNDHIRGLEQLAGKMGIPVFANSDTAKAVMAICGHIPQLRIFSTGETFSFGDLEIHPFSIQHDTLDPVAFTIRTQGVKVGFCTDLGHATTLVEYHLQDCDYLYIEANHQPSMVHACSRPPLYKQRVLGRQGHLSNEDCAALLIRVAHSGLKHVHLAHLSSECNAPELAVQIVREGLDRLGLEIEISIAWQDRISRSIVWQRSSQDILTV